MAANRPIRPLLASGPAFGKVKFVLSDPVFYAIAVPAVFLAGLSKGGIGGQLAMLMVPMMSLVISPVQAAAITLPILVAMDLIGVAAWRGIYDRRTLIIVLPGAVIGIAIGWLTASFVTADHVRLLVGLIAIAFVLGHWFSREAGRHPRPHNVWKGRFWSVVAGFTSFVSHTGGPPYQVYTLPLRLDPRVYVGTTIIIFTTINLLKVVPYFALGQFDTANIATSAVLLPVALTATLFGVWLAKRIDPARLYGLIYAAMFCVGIKLTWDGLRALATG